MNIDSAKRLRVLPSLRCRDMCIDAAEQGNDCDASSGFLSSHYARQRSTRSVLGPRLQHSSAETAANSTLLTLRTVLSVCYICVNLYPHTHACIRRSKQRPRIETIRQWRSLPSPSAEHSMSRGSCAGCPCPSAVHSMGRFPAPSEVAEQLPPPAESGAAHVDMGGNRKQYGQP